MHESFEVSCTACGHTETVGPTAMLDWLRRARRIRADVEHEPELLAELFRAASAKLACPECGAVGLVARPVASENDEAWGVARQCAACGRPIDRERLEALPEATLCVACQARDDRGESPDAPEYCPKCGSIMVTRQTRSPGVTRYVVACPKCGR
jgi:DNA-directed RNA polymerase subunit M/transcription elongation factor TFIIS